MKLSKRVKAIGLDDIKELIALSNVPRSTLYDMAKNNPRHFDVVLLGCVQLKMMRYWVAGDSEK